jgi:hypothetical protein
MKQYAANGKINSFQRVNLSMLKPGEKFRTITSKKEYEVVDSEGLVRDIESHKEGWLPLSFPCFKICTL